MLFKAALIEGKDLQVTVIAHSEGGDRTFLRSRGRAVAPNNP
jgi:hypothetical protein